MMATLNDRMGLEEAEMFTRYAGEIVRRLKHDPSDAQICAAEALIEKSCAIMQRLIDDEIKRPPQD